MTRDDLVTAIAVVLDDGHNDLDVEMSAADEVVAMLEQHGIVGVTAKGTVLGAEAIEALADEAERGYAVADWTTTMSEHRDAGLTAAAYPDDVLAQVRAERARQEAKFPEQHLPSIPAAAIGNRTILHGRYLLTDERQAKAKVERLARAGSLTWLDVLIEELAEAMEAAAFEPDANLRAELVQVAAVAVRWIEDLDRATNGAGDASA